MDELIVKIIQLFFPYIFHHFNYLPYGHILRVTSYLRHISYLFTIMKVVVYRNIVKSDGSPVSHNHSEDRFYQCCLAAAIRSDQSNTSSSFALEGDIIEYLQV